MKKVSAKRKGGIRNILGSPFGSPHPPPREIHDALRSALTGLWPSKGKSSRELIQIHPELAEMSCKKERGLRLKELKRAEARSKPYHTDRRFVKAGLKSCLKSLEELTVFMLDSNNGNVEAITSVLNPFLICKKFSLLYVPGLSDTCAEALGFPCMALGLTRCISDPSNRFYPVFETIFRKKPLDDPNRQEIKAPFPLVENVIPSKESPKDSISFGLDDENGGSTMNKLPSPLLKPTQLLKVPINVTK